MIHMKTPQQLLAAFTSAFLISASAHAAVSTSLTGLYKLDESSGSVLTNSGSSGATQNGAFQGYGADPGTNPTRVSGFIGTGALDFNGTSDVARLGDPQVLFGSATNLAVSTGLWFNADTVSSSGRLATFLSTSDGTAFSLGVDSTGVLQGIYHDGTSSSTVPGTTSLAADTWYHAAFTHASGATGAYNLYLNGVLEATTTGGLRAFGARSPVGAFDNFGSTPSAYLDGSLDDIGTWARAVTGKEVAAIHAMGRFEALSLDSPSTESLITAFDTTGSTLINGNQWQYTTGLTGVQGTTGGTANSNAFVILDGSGNGMQIVPEPSIAVMLLGGAGMLALLRRRRA